LHRARDRRNVANEIEVQVLIDRRVPRVRSGGFKQRIAIGFCPSHHFGGDIAAGSRAIFDDELLPKPLREPLSGEPRDDVIDAAGGITDEQTHRP
jgi:hypothetical protein